MEQIYLYQEYTKNETGFSIENEIFESEESAQIKLLDFIDLCKNLFEHEQIMRNSAKFWEGDVVMFAKVEKLPVNE